MVTLHSRNRVRVVLASVAGTLVMLTLLAGLAGWRAQAGRAAATAPTMTCPVCNDNNPDTLDYCLNGQCVFLPLDGLNPSLVFNTHDSGLGSLRNAIAQSAPGATVTFWNISETGNDVVNFFDGTPHTIALTTGQLVIDKNLTIQGPGAKLLTVSGNNASRVFSITGPSTTVTLNDLTIANGQSTAASGSLGGGIYVSYSTVNLNNCAVVNNTAVGGTNSSSYGGGIGNAGTMNLTNCTIAYNSASGSSIGNAAGGIGNAGAMNLTNCTIAHNSVGGGNFNQDLGGGIANSGTLTLTNCTVANNAISGGSNTKQGGGIANVASGAVAVRNTIIAGNSVSGTTTTTGPDIFGTFGTLGNNLIGKSDGGSGFSNGVQSDQVGTANVPRDPQLAAPGNYGGPTQTLRPLPGSSAINAAGGGFEIQRVTVQRAGAFTLNFNSQTTGLISTSDAASQVQSALAALSTIGAGNVQVFKATNDVFTIVFQGALAQANQPQLIANNLGPTSVQVQTLLDGGTLATDQRGFARPPQTASYDIGAVEVNYALAVTNGSGQSTIPTTAFANPLVATLTESGSPVSGVQLTFTAPGSGPSATLGTPNPATTNASGQASATATANATSGGPYQVTAGASGLTAVSFSLTNTCPAITVGTPANTGTYGVAYNSSVAVTPTVNAPLSYRYSLANGTTLPPGLTLDANTGAITGTPTAPGNVSFDLRVELFNDNTATGCAVTVQRSINITCVTDPVVTSAADSGTGSLREAIAIACPGNTITFANGINLITLTSGELVINKNLTIQGPGANVLTVSGNNASRVFNISSGVTVTMDALTIANGKVIMTWTEPQTFHVTK